MRVHLFLVVVVVVESNIKRWSNKVSASPLWFATVTTLVIGSIHATLERRGREYVDPGELLFHVRWLRWHRLTQD